jgi:glycosyltransferase involved in cell wall biosynthesis
MNEESKSPKVSVCVIAYNHEKYIHQCLQSIVEQVTDFDFEVIIGDDCSTDETRSIILDFANKYPSKIRPIFQRENIGGGVNNFLSVINNASGEYIARVDGDDFCYPNKLQAQVDLLDKNKDISMVGHLCTKVNEQGKVLAYDRPFSSAPLFFLGTNFLVQTANCIKASSTMYRRLAITSAEMNPCFDFYINLLISRSGRIVIINKLYGAYRINSAGISSNPTNYAELWRVVEYTFLYALKIGVPEGRVIRGRMIYRSHMLGRFLALNELPEFFFEPFKLKDYILSPINLKLFKLLQLLIGSQNGYKLTRFIYVQYKNIR